MLLNMSCTFTKSSFEKNLFYFKVYGLGMFLVGLITLILSIVFKNNIIDDFIDGFYSGTGVGFIVMGAILFFYSLLLPKNPEKYKKREIKYADERNQYIYTMSGNISFYISMLIIYIAAIVAGFYNLTIFVVLISIIILMFIIFVLSYLIIKALN